MFELDYDQMIFLDAEWLAEGGVAEAYVEEILPRLSEYVSNPSEIQEVNTGETDGYDEKAIYSVTSDGDTYEIYGPELDDDEGQNWGRAAHALFTIVNKQLQDQNVKLYAVNGGNDLGGFFLTVDQYEGAMKAIQKKSDRPYIVTLEHPSYGQHFP